MNKDYFADTERFTGRKAPKTLIVRLDDAASDSAGGDDALDGIEDARRTVSPPPPPPPAPEPEPLPAPAPEPEPLPEPVAAPPDDEYVPRRKR